MNYELTEKNGLFITFEGIDGCGKSTQVKKTVGYLEKVQDRKVIVLREPGGNEIGEKIREILLNKNYNNLNNETELLLFIANRVQLVKNNIKTELDKGNIVICDRFIDSTTAYQGYGRGLSIDFINSLNNFATLNGKIIPELTFLIDLSPIEANKRVISRGEEINRMEKEDISFFIKIYNGFKTIANNEPDRFVTIDGKNSIDNIFEDIKNELNSKLGIK